eukprot:scaffold876_cov68-Phaeocystis_antarctica.AAC.11
MPAKHPAPSSPLAVRKPHYSPLAYAFQYTPCVQRAQDGDLPLHNAVQHQASEVVVRLLLSAYPNGAKDKGRVCALPFHSCLELPCAPLRFRCAASPSHRPLARSLARSLRPTAVCSALDR